MRKFLALFSTGLLLLGQTPSVIPLAESPLPMVTQVSANYTGIAGQSLYCYWIVAKYAIGNAQVSSSQCVTVNPNGGGNVVVTWGGPNIPSQNAPKYALSYDVIRTIGNGISSACVNCFLANATTATTVTDSLGLLPNSYSFNTYGPGVVNSIIDNTSTDRAIGYDTTPGGKKQANIRHGVTLPTYCNLGDQFELDTVQSISLCGNNNNWVLATGGTAGGTGATGTTGNTGATGSTGPTYGPTVSKTTSFSIDNTSCFVPFVVKGASLVITLTGTFPVSLNGSGQNVCKMQFTNGNTGSAGADHITFNLVTNGAVGNYQTANIDFPPSCNGVGCPTVEMLIEPVSGVNYLITPAGANGSTGATGSTGASGATGATGATGGGGVTLIASGTSAMGTGAISSATCATVVTTSATGVASTDAIIWNPNGSIKAITGYVPATTGGLTIAAYPTTNNVNFDVCNWSGSTITPGALTLNWRVVR